MVKPGDVKDSDKVGGCWLKQCGDPASPEGHINFSINFQAFTEELTRLHGLLGNAEWIDLRIVKNRQPEGRRGYTHRLKVRKIG
ncbi:hypothetical protein DCC81_24710 [Chitinophaga parva]|uniref:Uncharacterized protein n=1 Tax=Chitinophaga parva TaxID=2169414 RepID=A0A2T7BBP2_9BACT|nr:hypothetical protein DCC81_24710 [Chitinophaga parva]